MQVQQPLSGLAGRLVKDGVFSADVARNAIEKARASQKPFISHIIDERLVSAHRAASAASDEFGLPLLDLNWSVSTSYTRYRYKEIRIHPFKYYF